MKQDEICVSRHWQGDLFIGSEERSPPLSPIFPFLFAPSITGPLKREDFFSSLPDAFLCLIMYFVYYVYRMRHIFIDIQSNTLRATLHVH